MSAMNSGAGDAGQRPETRAGADRGQKCRIKICGLSRPCDIDYVNILKPDYIGFVFARSRRQVSAALAKHLKERLDPAICAVGVFVNEAPERIAALAADRVIDMVQLHGQEDEAYLAALRALLEERLGKTARAETRGEGAGKAVQKCGARRGCPIIQAFSVKTSADVEKACQSSADYILLDHGAGGTGRAFDWSVIGGINRPFFLAGGLGPDNIEAAGRTGAFALDVSSGVETGGFKDFKKIELCVRRIRK